MTHAVAADALWFDWVPAFLTFFNSMFLILLKMDWGKGVSVDLNALPLSFNTPGAWAPGMTWSFRVVFNWGHPVVCKDGKVVA